MGGIHTGWNNAFSFKSLLSVDAGQQGHQFYSDFVNISGAVLKDGDPGGP